MSNDEKHIRLQSFNIPDPKLLFAWECPLLFETICKKYNNFSTENKKLNLRFSDYQNVLLPTPNGLSQNFEFLFKLKKNNQNVSKLFSISIKNKILSLINNNPENMKNVTEGNIIDNIEELIYIDYKFSGIQDIILEIKSYVQTFDLTSISFLWSVPHFTYESQYINGQKERLLRIKISDLLIGDNKIICEITKNFNKQSFKKNYNYNKSRYPYGGNCLVSPFDGFSMYTNFTFYIEGWKGSSLPLLFRIKLKTKSNILVDISDAGFFSQSISINNLPAGSNHIFLEVSDNQDRSVLFPCLVNIKPNNNLQPINNYIDYVTDIRQKMVLVDIYYQNDNANIENTVEEKNEINSRLEILNTYYQEISMNFNTENFFDNIDKVITFLFGLSKKNLKDINFQNLYDLLDLIINNIDPLLDDFSKTSMLFKIIDNLSLNIENKKGLISKIFYTIESYLIIFKILFSFLRR